MDDFFDDFEPYDVFAAHWDSYGQDDQDYEDDSDNCDEQEYSDQWDYYDYDDMTNFGHEIDDY